MITPAGSTTSGAASFHFSLFTIGQRSAAALADEHLARKACELTDAERRLPSSRDRLLARSTNIVAE